MPRRLVTSFPGRLPRPYRPAREWTYTIVMALLAAATAASVTLSVVVSPVLPAAAVGAVVLAVAASWRPGVVLAAGIVLTLAGGEFASWSSAGGILLAGGSAIAVLMSLVRGQRLPWRRLWLPLAILAWLSVRLLAADDPQTLVDIAKCLGAVLLVVTGLRDRRSALMYIGGAGMVFLALTVFLGESNTLGTRYSGISGNSNRMVFGVLVLLPFVVALAAASKNLVVRGAAVAGVVASLLLVGASGSSQGLVGLAAIVLVLLLQGFFRFAGGVRALFATVGVIVTIVVIPVAAQLVRASDDLSTLSGRTPLYAAAWAVIKENPLVGTGLQSVSDGSVVDRSAHSALLGLAATGGIPLGLAWTGVIVALLAATVRLSRRRDFAAAAAFVFVVEQFVQSVQLVPLSWLVIAYFLVERTHTQEKPSGDSPPTGRSNASVNSKEIRVR